MYRLGELQVYKVGDAIRGCQGVVCFKGRRLGNNSHVTGVQFPDFLQFFALSGVQFAYAFFFVFRNIISFRICGKFSGNNLDPGKFSGELVVSGFNNQGGKGLVRINGNFLRLPVAADNGVFCGARVGPHIGDKIHQGYNAGIPQGGTRKSWDILIFRQGFYKPFFHFFR